jgi:putative phosphoesterase
MRIGIISDTHDQLQRTIRAVEMLTAAGAEALIHCGDLTRPDIVCACAVLPLYFVFGNNDDDWPALQRAMKQSSNVTCLEWGGEVTLDGKRIAVVHGHLHKDVLQLLAARPDYLLSGHSHVAADKRSNGVRRINPGALHRAAEYTVALLDLLSDELEFFTVPR